MNIEEKNIIMYVLLFNNANDSIKLFNAKPANAIEECINLGRRLFVHADCVHQKTALEMNCER